MNKKSHELAGGVVAALGHFCLKRLHGGQFNLVESIFLFYTGSSIAGLPDFLEPATSGTHRGFFHSLAFLLLSGYSLHRILQQIKDEELKDILIALSTSFGSHYALDAFTPRGLPFFTNDF